jgi:MFS family permease
MSKDAPTGVFATLKATPAPVRNLLVGVLINQLAAFVQTFLLLYLTFQGVSAGVAGLCLAAYSVGSIFGTVLGGELTHRFGPRVTIVSAMALAGPLVASIPWLSRPGTFWLLIVVVALAGLVTQSYRPAAAVLLSDLMPEQYQVMAFSMMRIALNIGAALAPLIAAGLILVDWDLLYWLDGATALLYSALAFVLLPKKTMPAGAEPTGTDTGAKPATDRRSVYAAMVRDKKFLYYLAAVFLGTITYAQSTTALPLEVVADKYPTSLYSAVLTISSIVLITCELKITTYITKLPTHVAVFLGHFVNSLGFAVYALSSRSGVFVLVGTVLAVSGLMIAGPSMFAHPAKFPAGMKARYIGTMQAVVGLASAIGPVFGVFAWSRIGGGFWLLCGVLNGVAGLLATAGLKRTTEPSPAAEPGSSTEIEPEVVGGKA